MIDFRSDTVTRPTPEMREAMASAEVGSVQPQPIANEPDGSIDLTKARATQLRDYLADQGILITAGDPIRFVTHRDVHRQNVDHLLDAIRRFYHS